MKESKGIKHNKKFNFWVVYKNFNKKGNTDKREFVNNEKEALDKLI